MLGVVGGVNMKGCSSSRFESKPDCNPHLPIRKKRASKYSRHYTIVQMKSTDKDIGLERLQKHSPPLVDRISLWVYYSKVPIYLIFYLLKGDYYLGDGAATWVAGLDLGFEV